MNYRTSLFILLVALTQSCSESSPSQKTPADAQQPIEAPTPAGQTTVDTPSFLDREEEGSGIDYEKKFTNLPPAHENVIDFGTFQFKKPATWFWVSPTSLFVMSSYVLPGIQGEDSGMLTISEFQKSGGGDFDTNVIRWKNQFRTFGGAPIKPVIGNIEVLDKTLQTVHIRGEYMGAGAAWHKPDHTMIIVLIENDTNRYFLKMLGPTETISAHRESLYDAIQSLEIVPES